MRGGIRERERSPVEVQRTEFVRPTSRLISREIPLVVFHRRCRIRRESSARANVMPDCYAQSLPRVSCFMANETKNLNQKHFLQVLYICIYIYTYMCIFNSIERFVHSFSPTAFDINKRKSKINEFLD